MSAPPTSAADAAELRMSGVTWREARKPLPAPVAAELDALRPVAGRRVSPGSPPVRG